MKRQIISYLSKYIPLLLIFSLYFPIRWVFLGNAAYYTGAYSNFTSFSLYLSDVVVLILFFVLLRQRSLVGQFPKLLWPLILWLGLSLILDLAVRREYLDLNLYFTCRFGLLLLAFSLPRVSDIGLIRRVLSVFAGLAACQSLIAIAQVWLQSGVGLKYFGESPLDILTLGIAKVVSHGTTFIRPYGTLPHPNLLSALLLVAILVSVYLISTTRRPSVRLVVAMFLVLNSFGLVATLSRAAWISLIVSLIILGAGLQLTRLENKMLVVKCLMVIGLALAGAIAVFHPLIFSRATFADSATKERVFYNNLGKQLIKNQPFAGTGIGESVLHMERVAGSDLRSWEIQPVHNYYILSLAELGVIGGMILVATIIYIYIKLAVSAFRQPSIARLVAVSIFSGMLTLMLFDHYFYTIPSTQYLLWITLGAAYRLSLRDNRGTKNDESHPDPLYQAHVNG